MCLENFSYVHKVLNLRSCLVHEANILAASVDDSEDFHIKTCFKMCCGLTKACIIFPAVSLLTFRDNEGTEENQEPLSVLLSTYGSFHSLTSICRRCCSVFGLISAVVCPLDRVATDHNQDNTTVILRDWLVKVQNLYHYVEWRPKEEPT